MQTPLTSCVTIFLERKRVLADSSPPNVLDGAAALAVDTLDLVLSDNRVLQGSAIL